MSTTLIGMLIVAYLLGVIVYVLARYPDFRRAFVDHWRAENVRRRLDTFAERMRER